MICDTCKKHIGYKTIYLEHTAGIKICESCYPKRLQDKYIKDNEWELGWTDGYSEKEIEEIIKQFSPEGYISMGDFIDCDLDY